jgi:hypothetical protein
MKSIAVIFTFLLNGLCCFSQHSIKGLWYSKDSSRVYQIYDTSKGLTATLYASQRKNDKIGVVVLNNVTYNVKKKKYDGIMYAISDNKPIRARLKISTDGKMLSLKLPRLIIFPVHLKWIRYN